MKAKEIEYMVAGSPQRRKPKQGKRTNDKDYLLEIKDLTLYLKEYVICLRMSTWRNQRKR